MARKTYAIAFAAALSGIAVVYAQTKEPDNGPELVKVLREKYGVEALLNRDNQIYGVSLEDVPDLPNAVDRIVTIPTIQVVAFHWELERGHVDGTVLEKLGRLPKLEVLDARYCKIQNEDVAGLEALNHLKQLRLDGNPISDAALIHLKPLQKLELLSLDSTKVAGDGFKHLASLPRLRNLYLPFTPITDDSMEMLGRIHSLQVLDMHGTSISNDGIMHLTGLYRLHNLAVDTKASEEFHSQHATARAEAEKNGLLPKNHPDLQIIGR